MNKFIMIFIGCFVLSGCQTMTSITPQISNINFCGKSPSADICNQQEAYLDGAKSIRSEIKTGGAHSVVNLSTSSSSVENGSRIRMVLSVQNLGQELIDFNPKSIQVDVSPALSEDAGYVYTYDELIREQEKARNTAMALTALSGAFNTMAASYSGYQTTTGTYSGSTYGTYGSTYSSGTYTASTYDSAAAQNAMNQANAQTQASLNQIQSSSDIRLADLKNNILKSNTLEPNMWFGGVVVFESSGKLKEDETITYSVTVPVGLNKHTFKIEQEIIQD